MKLPPLSLAPLSLLDVPRLGLASFRRRILVRAVFILLALATLVFAVVLLQEEKERSYGSYEQNFRKTQAEIAARLRHPAGQLALMNPTRSAQALPVRPLVLPYAALDFDDQYKAQQAVETAGCSLQYPDGSSLCVAVGNNPYAGGFLYIVGSFASPALVPRERGELDLSQVHRARVVLTRGGETLRWIAPFEISGTPDQTSTRGNITGRLTGFVADASDSPQQSRPVRDFRGWLWQGSRCATPGTDQAPCPRRAFFSIRLPVDAYRDALFAQPRPIWPPADLAQTEVHVQMLSPQGQPDLFSSDTPDASAPMALKDIEPTLLPGETLQIRRLGNRASPTKPSDTLTLRGADDSTQISSPLLTRLISLLPVETLTPPTLVGHDTIATPAGSYELTLSGNVRGIERALSAVATRVSWYVGAMLGAILLAWLAIEFGLLRQVKVLTRRAAAVSYNVNAKQVEQRLGALDVSDLRGKDELGILAGALSDLLQRVQDDIQREHIRAEQERDMWHAVGHEIMSPLQSLMVLHPQSDDASHRYVQRMQQAVKVLYGQASPSEALQAATLNVGTLDLDNFLRTVADNAPFAGVNHVHYRSAAQPVMARADEFSLEDVVTHILRNADRHRLPDSPITLSIETTDSTVNVMLHNQGPHIPDELLERIFDYGVSGTPAPTDMEPAPASRGQRGQGLFVAKTYMAKMGGTIAARNEPNGVSFVLTLQRN